MNKLLIRYFIFDNVNDRTRFNQKFASDELNRKQKVHGRLRSHKKHFLAINKLDQMYHYTNTWFKQNSKVSSVNLICNHYSYMCRLREEWRPF